MVEADSFPEIGRIEVSDKSRATISPKTLQNLIVVPKDEDIVFRLNKDGSRAIFEFEDVKSELLRVRVPL
jgi:hypothetical protein